MVRYQPSCSGRLILYLTSAEMVVGMTSSCYRQSFTTPFGFLLDSNILLFCFNEKSILLHFKFILYFALYKQWKSQMRGLFLKTKHS